MGDVFGELRTALREFGTGLPSPLREGFGKALKDVGGFFSPIEHSPPDRGIPSNRVASAQEKVTRALARLSHPSESDDSASTQSPHAVLGHGFPAKRNGPLEVDPSGRIYPQGWMKQRARDLKAEKSVRCVSTATFCETCCKN